MKEGSGMNFIRARGEEQKKIRIQQIVDAAASLYAEVGYDKVTFSQIGRKLSFSRLNLYNYLPCLGGAESAPPADAVPVQHYEHGYTERCFHRNAPAFPYGDAPGH